MSQVQRKHERRFQEQKVGYQVIDGAKFGCADVPIVQSQSMLQPISKRPLYSAPHA